MDNTTLDAETLRLLRESLERYGCDQYTMAIRRAAMATPDGFSRKAWRDYSDMGWLAMPLSAAQGGFDSAPQSVGALMQYAGATLAMEPLLAQVVFCGRLLQLIGSPAALAHLESLGAGDVLFAFAHAEHSGDGMVGEVHSTWSAGTLTGRKLVVLHGDVADRFIVTARGPQGRLGLYMVDARQPGVARESFRLVDGRGAANLTLDAASAVELTPGRDADELVQRMLDDARLALCAEAYGASKALNALTLAHLKDRQQFGKPLGVNQTLQHRMVELFILEEEGRAVMAAAYRAEAVERRAAILAASAHLMSLARLASHEAVQLHGGIGITEEYAVSHYFRRLMVVNRLLGDRARHVREFAAEAQRAAFAAHVHEPVQRALEGAVPA